MKDSIMGKYPVRIANIDIRTVRMAVNDPRGVGLSTDHIDDLREEARSGRRLPLMGVVATSNKSDGFIYDALYHRHCGWSLTPEDDKDKLGTYFVDVEQLPDTLTADERSDLAFAENAKQHKVLKMPRAQYVKKAVELFEQRRMKSSEVAAKLAELGCSERTIRRICADASTRLTHKVASKIIQRSKTERLTLEQALASEHLYACVKPVTILEAARKITGESDSGVTATVPQQVASVINEMRKDVEGVNTRVFTMLDECKEADRPSDEILQAAKNIIKAHEKGLRFAKEHYDKLYEELSRRTKAFAAWGSGD